jgi:hypothetical protein
VLTNHACKGNVLTELVEIRLRGIGVTSLN